MLAHINTHAVSSCSSTDSLMHSTLNMRQMAQQQCNALFQLILAPIEVQSLLNVTKVISSHIKQVAIASINFLQSI